MKKLNPKMNKLLRKLAIIFFPSFFWIALTALGFGAQSLSNSIELFGIFLLSLICSFLPERFIKFKYLIILLCLIAFLSRLLMPNIPE